MENDEFYVGYLDKGPTKTMKFTRVAVFIVALVLVVSGILLAIGQKQFSNGTFELGKLTEIEGVLYSKPYPVLRVTLEKNEFKDVLLLGFGKFGAESGLSQIASNDKQNGIRFRLKGTLIYYNGATLMQLEPDVEGTYEILDEDQPTPKAVSMGSSTLVGEIIDPKCYFGVMKPGRGKIHRSCAVRCISGGIPPVFVTTSPSGENAYFLLTDNEGKAANELVLNYIGKPCSIQGELAQVGQWLQLRVDPSKIEISGTNSSVY